VTFIAPEKHAKGIAAQIGTRQAFLVALDQGRDAGLATCDRLCGGVGHSRMMDHAIQLASGVSGRAFGRMLMAAVEDRMRAGGAHSMFAGASAQNPAGCPFHVRLGYTETAALPAVGWTFGRWMDPVLMQKFLA
jgi:phosphinothricin acetyltransferase